MGRDNDAPAPQRPNQENVRTALAALISSGRSLMTRLQATLDTAADADDPESPQPTSTPSNTPVSKV